MSVGPEALRRFGPLLFLACPWGRAAVRAPRVFRAAVRARGAGLLCVPHGCSGRRRARPPARLGVLTAFGAASRGPPWPSGPSGTLHTSGAVVADIARRVVSKPGQTPPPPTSAAARPTNSSRAHHTGGAVVADVARRVASKPIQATPPPTGTAARPTNSSGTIHTSVVCRYCAYPIQATPPPTSAAAIPSRFSVLSTPVTVGFYRIRSWLPACRGSNDATFPFGGGEATT